ncbi:KTSC domain-containing protein [Sphingobacterium sp. UBA6320]|uniref:KTSC domain-containing protein n=1 Tax=Sphingobacterium sp. UBA6320 TaxID=1947510 RepID=UPI0025EA6325|nr:KTSC domain-containing protein [Sphingobacterium sp. UBA6320]
MKKLTFYDVSYEVDARYEDYAVFKLPSSNVDFCGHKQDEGKETCEFFVQFMNGGTYIYKDVDPEVVKKASQAESIGKYIRAEISGKYTSTKLIHQIMTKSEKQ